ncbi:GGDEF domain-containing protein [Tardiphaga sp. vice278]|uniref:GGDEF domain-containing protein n=1 Tax=Tardiphaga sp. vice278 TaxID=2592815 RepID=UPI00116261E5|nr:sensor domain-containing diguanylate cyclase [Tardiphaga sp. vice278]QDM15417.1 GGDEF domain-containing protein [Tardiphaga sp. vice278]
MFPLAKTQKSAPRRGTTTLIVTAMLAVVVGFSAISVNVLLHMRKAAWELARQSSENLASTLDADIRRNIDVYDISLRAVVTNIMIPEIGELSPAIRHLILFDQAATAKHFGPLKVFNAAGHLMIDSSALEPAPDRAVNREYFQVHRTDENGGLFVSHPAADAKGEMAVYLSRRISGTDGAFGGVVVGSIRLSYFHDLFRRVKLGPEDSLTLIHRDGFVVMRSPFDIAMVGRDLRGVVGIERIRSEQTGWLEAPGAVDGVPRQFVWRDGGGPLVTLLGKSLASIYDPWQSDAAWILSAMAVLAIVATGASILLAREMRKRSADEHRFALLSITDGLTGLANRRQFDDILQSEWLRNQRNKTSLALLLIDVDYFKIFNDTYGHQGGDRALKQIATTIRHEVQRAADCAARYGGEEFAVILPEATIESAQMVAERIRSAVQAISLDGAHITVSIGIAAVVPASNWQPAELIAATDAALYNAKDAGRNQCRSARPLTPAPGQGSAGLSARSAGDRITAAAG